MVSYKVILDADPGIDDAIAIIIALQSVDIEVLAITTVNGNI
jgi:purine nucleosidase